MGCGALSRKSKSSKPRLTILLFPGQFVHTLDDNIYTYYNIQKELGSGSFGRVVLATHILTGRLRAIKIISKYSIKNLEARSRIITEVTILKSLDHPNIVKIYEFYEDDFNLYLIMDLCSGGELLEFIIKKGHLNERMAADFMRQILETTCYLHSQKIIHRDLKLENILIDDSNSKSVKIVDFGTATYFNKNGFQKLRIGTINYMAPEVLNKSYNEKCDIWSCGVILYVLLSGSYPFKGSTRKNTIDLIKTGQYSSANGTWTAVSDEAKDLLSKMLEINQTKRISAEEAFNHPWIKRTESPSISRNLLEDVSNNLKSFHATSKIQRAVIRFIASQLLTPYEKKELVDIFRGLYDNGLGKISKEQLKVHWKKIFSEDIEEHQVSSIMAELDTSKNGFIEYSEFVAAAIDRKKLLRVERLDEVFSTFDRDHNGKISASELRTILDCDQNLDLQLYKNAIKEADINGDGQVDFKEFITLMNSMIK